MSGTLIYLAGMVAAWVLGLVMVVTRVMEKANYRCVAAGAPALWPGAVCVRARWRRGGRARSAGVVPRDVVVCCAEQSVLMATTRVSSRVGCTSPHCTAHEHIVL